MYKCEECGLIFEDLAHWSEDRGEYWGMPCSERMSGCPRCYSTDVDEYFGEDDDEEGDEDDDG